MAYINPIGQVNPIAQTQLHEMIATSILQMQFTTVKIWKQVGRFRFKFIFVICSLWFDSENKSKDLYLESCKMFPP